MGRLNWLLLCAVCLVEGMDMNLLPSSFRAMEAELGFSPTGLAIFQALQGTSLVVCANCMSFQNLC